MNAIGIMVALVAITLPVPRLHAAPGPAQRCQAAKTSAVAKYVACLLDASVRAERKQTTPDYADCEARLSATWFRIQTKVGPGCATTGDLDVIRGQASQRAAWLSAPPAASRFVDNGDETVTDVVTGLMWERKTLGSGCRNCVDDLYSWSEAMTTWLSAMNGGPRVRGHAGYDDWRMPTAVELSSLVATDGHADAALGPYTPAFYYSASTDTFASGFAVVVGFHGLPAVPLIGFSDKTQLMPARAVRTLHVQALNDLLAAAPRARAAASPEAECYIRRLKMTKRLTKCLGTAQTRGVLRDAATEDDNCRKAARATFARLSRKYAGVCPTLFPASSPVSARAGNGDDEELFPLLYQIATMWEKSTASILNLLWLLTMPCDLCDNRDGTVTDKRPLFPKMWEKKTGERVSCIPWPACQQCPLSPIGVGSAYCDNPHDVNNWYELSYARSEWLSQVNGPGTAPGLANHSDWSLPSFHELIALWDEEHGYCAEGSGPCIDPVFDPTAPESYWTTTELPQDEYSSECLGYTCCAAVNFGIGGQYGWWEQLQCNEAEPVRAVRLVKPVPSLKRVFVTAQTFPSADLGGVAGADQKCADAAAAGGLSGVYRAWISDASTSPSARFSVKVSDYFVNEGLGNCYPCEWSTNVVARSWTDLTDGTLENPIKYTEQGTSPSLGAPVFTATSMAGTFAGPDCDAWHASSGFGATRGQVGATDQAWTDAPGSVACDVDARLYCVQQY